MSEESGPRLSPLFVEVHPISQFELIAARVKELESRSEVQRVGLCKSWDHRYMQISWREYTDAVSLLGRLAANA